MQMSSAYINFFDSTDSNLGVLGPIACVFGGIGLAVTVSVIILQLTAFRETRALSKMERLIPVGVGVVSIAVLTLGVIGVSSNHPVHDRQDAMAANIQHKYGLILDAAHRCPPPQSVDDCFTTPQPYLLKVQDPETGTYKTDEYFIRWNRATGEPFIVSQTTPTPNTVPQVTPSAAVTK